MVKTSRKNLKRKSRSNSKKRNQKAGGEKNKLLINLNAGALYLYNINKILF